MVIDLLIQFHGDNDDDGCYGRYDGDYDALQWDGLAGTRSWQETWPAGAQKKHDYSYDNDDDDDDDDDDGAQKKDDEKFDDDYGEDYDDEYDDNDWLWRTMTSLIKKYSNWVANHQF